MSQPGQLSLAIPPWAGAVSPSTPHNDALALYHLRSCSVKWCFAWEGYAAFALLNVHFVTFRRGIWQLCFVEIDQER